MNIRNINITEEQENNARMHSFDTVFEISEGNTRMIGMAEPMSPAGDDFWTNGNQSQIIVNFEVANWEDDEPVNSTVQFFPEDFDGAMEEFQRMRREQTTTINDVIIFIASVIAFFTLINL